jgi:predicted small secreted protein
MMKTLALIVLLIIIAMIASPSLAGSDNKPTANHVNHWNGVGQDFKNDCKKIANNIKDTGANIGHACKNEFQKMPENVRQGYKAARNDLKTFTGSERVNPTQK